MDGQGFNTWLSNKLLCINKDVDLDVFVEYITGILETDSSRDDKNESLEGIVGEILVCFWQEVTCEYQSVIQYNVFCSSLTAS